MKKLLVTFALTALIIGVTGFRDEVEAAPQLGPQMIHVISAKPKISGLRIVVTGVATTNEVLRVSKVFGRPAGSTLTVKWLRDGTAIPGANQTAYKVSKYDLGTKLVAAVTVKKSGYSVTTVRSQPQQTFSRLQRTIATKWPGYPVVVSADSVDRRIQSWLTTAKEYVAIAPGIYTPYNHAVPNLVAYVETAPVSGDCMVKNMYFPTRGGACWDGVYPGTEEPEFESSSAAGLQLSPRPTNTPAPAKPSPSQIAMWQATIDLNKLLIQSNQESIASLKSQKTIKTYHLSVAVRYGDDLRAQVLREELSVIENRIAILSAEVIELTAEIADMQLKISG